MRGTPTHVTSAQLAIAAVAVLVSLWIDVTWIGAVAVLGLSAVMACGKVVESRAFKRLDRRIGQRGDSNH